MEAGTHGNSEGFLPPALERSLPDDAAEYMLFVVDDTQTASTNPAGGAATKPRTRLDQVRKATLKLAEDLTKNYIWQRDSFNLEIVSRNSLLYLRGITSYGDCVEDEWLIVYILREISKQFADVWVRIGDSDGEFLLVEAAKAVPRWLNPEMDANRIWIHNGQLMVIPLEAQASSKPSLELADAVQIIKTTPSSLVHIPALEKEAFHRLRKYPGHVTTSIYHTRLVLPRKIAHVLHDRPRAIAPAVEAFVARDPILTKKVFGTTTTPSNTKTDDKASIATKHQLQFPPTDFVVVSVKFTRVLYAQLRGQRFTPPTGWPAAFGAFCEEQFLSQSQKDKGKAAETDKTPDLEKLQATLEVSMKLACGFELMAATADTSNNRIVREVALVLEDLEEDDSELPSDQEIRQWDDVDREDDDAWLNIDFDDFERELDSGRKEEEKPLQNEGSSSLPKKAVPTESGAGFGDAGVQTDLRRIVSQFQAFLNDNDAGIEGAEFDEMDEDDDDDDYEDEDDSEDGEGVDFDEDEFNRLMREMMGMPPAEGTVPKAKEEPKTTPKTAATATTTKSAKPAAAEDDDMESILKLAAQFEAELKGHGALKLNPPKSKNSSKEITDGKGSSSRATSQSNEDDEDEEEDDDDDEVDVDFNLAKNLLESFKGQEGMAGPAGNILSMLGMALPRDKDDDEEEDED